MMRIAWTLIVLTAVVLTCTSARSDDLEAGFRNPPESSRPGCYWYWINDNISKEGITKDLEAMAPINQRLQETLGLIQ